MKRIEQWLRDRMGMDFNTVGPAVLERTVRQRMRLRGVTSLREYYAVLTDSTAEAEELIELAVVPETWFFRDPEAFRALTQLARTALDITTFGPAADASAGCRWKCERRRRLPVAPGNAPARRVGCGC